MLRRESELAASLFKRKRLAGNNPWGSATLEWTTTSPPPTHNFQTIPTVTHGPYDLDETEPQPTYPGGSLGAT